jgi:isoquinoline 1-oxidoreductase alpha subunit
MGSAGRQVAPRSVFFVADRPIFPLATFASRQFDFRLPGPRAIVMATHDKFAANGGSRTMINLLVNGRRTAVDVEPEMPLLWALRDELGMVGTKFGCGAGLCGACTVIIDGEATRSCITPVSEAANKTILTIEGLGEKELHAVQKAWIEADAPQCGYCQSGQIMAAVALLSHNPHPTDADIDAEMSNICRCGTYPRMRAAVHRAAELVKI